MVVTLGQQYNIGGKPTVMQINYNMVCIVSPRKDHLTFLKRKPFPSLNIYIYYYERSELLIDGDGKKVRIKTSAVRKKMFAVRKKNVRRGSAFTGQSYILEDYCTYSPSHLFWRQRSFRRAIASSVHAAAVGSA